MFPDAPSEILFIESLLYESAALAQAIREDGQLRSLSKSDRSPVTAADFAVQALASYRLQAAFPGAVLVGEEGAQALRNGEDRALLDTIVRHLSPFIPEVNGNALCDWIDGGAGAPNDNFWTLDPIDGTKGYIRGGQYAIALACIRNGTVVYGGLACPVLDLQDPSSDTGGGIVAVAGRGHNAWYTSSNDNHVSVTDMRVSTCDNLSEARLMRSYEGAHTDVTAMEKLGQLLGITQERHLPMDSQAKYTFMAAGGAEMLFRLLSPAQPDYRECIWDQAAGSLLLEEAGGRITDLKGKTLDFSQGKRLNANEGLFASNGLLHDLGLNALASLL